MVKLCQVYVRLISSGYGILLSTSNICIPKEVSFFQAIIAFNFVRLSWHVLGASFFAVNPYKSSRSTLISKEGVTSHWIANNMLSTYMSELGVHKNATLPKIIQTPLASDSTCGKVSPMIILLVRLIKRMDRF